MPEEAIYSFIIKASRCPGKFNRTPKPKSPFCHWAKLRYRSFLLTHLNFSCLRNCSSCSACFLLRDRKANILLLPLTKIQCLHCVSESTLSFWSINHTATGGHYWQQTHIALTSAPQSSVASRSSFCLSLLHPSVPLKLSLFQGGVSPPLFVSSPLLSSLPLHADTHHGKQCENVSHSAFNFQIKT